MQLGTLSRLLGGAIFLGICTFCIPGVARSFIDYWNSQGTLGSVFQVVTQLLGISIAIMGGFIFPFIDADQWRTKEQRREVYFTLSTSLNLALIPLFIVGLSWYGSWEHDKMHHNLIAGLFWLLVPLTGSINMMRSKSTSHFQGLRLIKSS